MKSIATAHKPMNNRTEIEQCENQNAQSNLQTQPNAKVTRQGNIQIINVFQLN